MVAYSAVAFTPRAPPRPNGHDHDRSRHLGRDGGPTGPLHELPNHRGELPYARQGQDREVVTEIDKVFPDNERDIGLDRVLAGIDRSQIVPKNVEGVKGIRPRSSSARSPRSWSTWMARRSGSDQGERPRVRGQHELGPVPARSDQAAISCAATRLAEANDVRGPWSPAAELPDSFTKLPADDNWKDVKAAVPGRRSTSERSRRCS